MRKFVLPLLLVLVASWPAGAGAQVTVVRSEPLLLRSGAGAASVVVQNKGMPVLLALNAGAFVDETSRLKMSGVKVSFAPEGGAPALPNYLAAGQSLGMLVQVSGLNSASAEAQLFNGAVQAGALRAVAIDMPLNLTLAGPGAAGTPLPVYSKKEAELTVQNGGKDYLTLEWQCEVSGTVIGRGTVRLTPNGLERLRVTPKSEIYSWKEFIRPSHRQGRVLFRLKSNAGAEAGPMPVVTLPVDLMTMRFSQDTSNILFALWVMVFLLVGGGISLLGSAVLPNTLRKIGMRRRIGDLADRTSSVSARVDSYLRVLLRLERSKIAVALKEIGPLSLSSAEGFEDVTGALNRLDRRLVVAERLDNLLRSFEEVCNWAPPSISAEIDGILHSAAKQMHSLALPDEDVNASMRTLDKAEARIAELSNSEAQAARIAANHKELLARARSFPLESYQDLKQALPGIFRILESTEEEMRAIVPPMFFAVDHAIASVHAAFDYVMVRSSVCADMGGICSEAGQEIRARHQAHECELIEQLGTLSWRSLSAAKLLVRQLRENIFDTDILAEMGKRRPDNERRVRIVFDTQKARPYLPVYFSIAFDDPRFKNAAALQALSFHWQFPDGIKEDGCKVCHYFTGAEAKLHHSGKIKITLQVQSQRTLAAATTLEETIEVKGRRERQNTRAFAEMVRFSIAFGVALAGLEAGAIDRLSKLDFLPATIAVIALGFGADSIKNLLNQGGKKPVQ